MFVLSSFAILKNPVFHSSTFERVPSGARPISPFFLSSICLKRSFIIPPGFDLSTGTIVIPMDGDLQNDPKDIPKLIEKINEGYDVVLARRKSRKGETKIKKIVKKKNQ